MQTIFTLDDDVAAALERMRKARDVEIEKLINDLLRRGLKDLDAPSKRREPFRTRSVALGRPRFSNIDNIGEAVAVVESETFK
jgi:hypothetical protein